VNKEGQIDNKSAESSANLAAEIEEFFRTAPSDREERRAFQRANTAVLSRED
jgi:hypothetical protein